MAFTVASVPATKVSEDGQTVTLRLQDAQGGQLDIEARYTVLEDIANALNEATTRAHRARRMTAVVDESVSAGDLEPTTIVAYRFAPSDDKSAMLLSLQTSTGRTDILLPADKAKEFVAEANQHLELLLAPHRMN
jgi:hypothetical protein